MQSINHSKSNIRKFAYLSSVCIVSLILCEASFATNCVGYASTDPTICGCLDGGAVVQSQVQRNNATGAQMNAPVNV